MDLDNHALWWAENFVLHASKRSAEMVAERCGKELSQAGIFHGIELSVIDKAKLAAELKAREFARGRPYTQDEVEAEVINLASVCVYVYLSQHKAQVRNIIARAFNIRGDSEEELEGTDVCTAYYYISMEEEQEERLASPRLIEIQVITDNDNRQFQEPHEVAAFLQKWASVKGRSENDYDDAGLLLEVLNILGLNRHGDLCDIVLDLDMSTAFGSEFSRRADSVAPLELSLVMYVVDSIIRSPRGQRKIRDITSDQEGRLGSIRHRYQMRVLRDTFIWLAEIYPWGEGTGAMLFKDLDILTARDQRQRIEWLDSLPAQSFHKGERDFLSPEESGNLAKLWAMFEGHTQLPALYAFNLARLGVKGKSLPSWPHLRRSITDLVYHRGNGAGPGNRVLAK